METSKYAIYDQNTGTVVMWSDSGRIAMPALADNFEKLQVSEEVYEERQTTYAKAWVIDGKITNVDPKAPTQEEIMNNNRQYKIGELRRKCQADILSGFTSKTLGYECFYPSEITDQHNYNCYVTAGVTSHIWCRRNNKWDLTTHTAAQTKQVQVDFTLHKINLTKKLALKVAAVEKSTTSMDLQVIEW